MTSIEHGALVALRRLFSVRAALISVWILAVLWGERWIFQGSLRECEWHNWENWASIPYWCLFNGKSANVNAQPLGSNPHHVVLIADPQLVDPHTYPGRPWPLSTLTIKYTDLYLRRSYRLLQDHLDPDSLFFLGDLFDGGREWGGAKTAEKRYKKYGQKYWLKEYSRFAKLFFRGWRLGNSSGLSESRGRKLVSSLPGNHDLGFANGISPLVKERFDAYFGPLNRMDIVGNHTFISLDTVSLSALDQPDPATGESGAGDGTAANTANSNIWKPAHDFLEAGKDIKRRAIQREVGQISGRSDQYYSQDSLAAFSSNVTSLEANKRMMRQDDKGVPPTSSFPTVILTHVPLFRPADTNCGPMRERGSAISITRGFQYQNVLTPSISQDIISKLGAEEVAQVYSGDDHDYCEIEHNEFTGRIREITVKSMSWAMGVRRPGFLAVSLWNPVDLAASRGNNPHPAMPKGTIQNHLCLLPDQLTIFIRYAQLLGLTLLVLAITTIKSRSQKPTDAKSEPLLPLSEHVHQSSTSSQTSAVSASPPSIDSYLSTRSGIRPTARPTSPSKLGGYGNIPVSSRSSSPVKGGVVPFPVDHGWGEDPGADDWGMPTLRRRGRSQKRTLAQEFGKTVWQTAAPVLVFYLWIVWNG